MIEDNLAINEKIIMFSLDLHILCFTVLILTLMILIFSPFFYLWLHKDPTEFDVKPMVIGNRFVTSILLIVHTINILKYINLTIIHVSFLNTHYPLCVLHIYLLQIQQKPGIIACPSDHPGNLGWSTQSSRNLNSEPQDVEKEEHNGRVRLINFIL